MWFRPFSARNHASFGHKVYHALSKGYSEGSSANSLWGLQDFFFWHSRRIARGLVYCSGCLIKARPPAQPRSYPQALITVAKNGQGLAIGCQVLAVQCQGLAVQCQGMTFQTRHGVAWRVPNSNINSNITGNKGETTMRGRTGHPSRE